MGHREDEAARQLDLQSVLALRARQEQNVGEHQRVEQKIAKLIALVEELRHDWPEVRDRQDAVAEAMTNAMDPEAVISVLEEGLEVSHTIEHADPGTQPKKSAGRGPFDEAESPSRPRRRPP